MKKIIWIPLIIVIVGVLIALGGMAAGGPKGFWIDRGGVQLASTERGNLISVDETYTEFKNIEIDADFFDRITIKEGDAFTVKGQNYERFGGLKVKLEGETVKVDAKRERRWVIGFGTERWVFNDDLAWLEITYPKGTKLGDVKGTLSAARVYIHGLECKTLYIKDDFGDVDLEDVRAADNLTADLSAGRLKTRNITTTTYSVSNNFGDAEIEDVQADNMTLDLSAGKLTTKNITATTFSASNDFGKIDIDGAVANSVTLKLSSGDLSANDVKAGNVTVKSSFGLVSLDRLEFTGVCDVQCNSGDVNIGVLMNEDALAYDLKTAAGSVSVDGKKMSGSVTNRVSGASADLRASADFGSVRLNFLK